MKKQSISKVLKQNVTFDKKKIEGIIVILVLKNVQGIVIIVPQCFKIPKYCAMC